MAKVYILQLDEKQYSPEFQDLLLQYLPVSGRKRVQDRLNISSKMQTIAGELLARYAVGQFISDSARNIDIIYGEKGKPHIENLDEVHFNISHSGHYVVCAVATTEIGIDIERIRKVNLRIAERFFSASEIKDLMNYEEQDRMQYFITLWTIKESFLKAIGRGLTQHLNSFTIIKKDNAYYLTGNKEAEKYSIGLHKISDNYLMAVCSQKPATEYNIEFVTTTNLTKTLSKYI